jgi:UDP-glucose 6-dehydrogenase
MKITVIGSDYVGLVTGACLAEFSNEVFCLGSDQKKIDLLNSGGVRIYEPSLEEMISRNRTAGRIGQDLIVLILNLSLFRDLNYNLNIVNITKKHY